jgi:hypothetical protein
MIFDMIFQEMLKEVWRINSGLSPTLTFFNLEIADHEFIVNSILKS